MDFAATFWATMAGALSGAVVGAFASWLFSHELRKRDRRDAHHATMTLRLAGVVESLGQLEVQLMFDLKAAAEIRRNVLVALRAASLDADADELAVMIAARDAVQVLDRGREDSVRASAVGAMLIEWWRGEAESARVVPALGRMAFDSHGVRRPVQL